MSFTLHEISLPLMGRALKNLTGVIEKAEAHVKEKGIDPVTLIEARLAPDMFPFKNQIYTATDTAKGCAARLAGVDVPSFPDVEQTFPELRARIGKTVDYLKSIKPEQVNGNEDKQILMKTPARTLEFTGRTYLFNFVLPNFYFHVTTAYDILRHNGVLIGKLDYLGSR